MPTCPEGHDTAATDYCDVCGSPVTMPAAQPTSSAAGGEVPVRRAARRSAVASVRRAATIRRCPNPRRPPQPTEASASIEWTAIVTADRDYYKRVIARGGPDTVDFPEFFPERRITLYGNTLIGRANRKQGVEPGIDLGIHPVDRGVSTQHAVLRIRDSGLTITDLGSTNGTSLNDSDDLLGNGEEIALADGDRIHVGAWTTITVTQSEKGRT